ncbi:MAG: 5-formyltetrahydrofolate cyclo-ligase [Actinomycetota bacterium]
MAADKQEFRERVWAGLREAGAARFPGARGRIPNFTGAEAAAARLAGLPEWERASALKANPDSPQLPVRTRALVDGKIVYMAVPRLRADKPFFALDPARLDVPPRRAASIGGSAAAGIPVSLGEMQPIDLIVCGTVAVNPEGVRIGKGGGYSDLEFALAAEAGLIGPATVVATTVHPIQVLHEALPETEHDFRVDLIVTPDETIRCPGGRRPPGIIWEHLDDEKIAAIPALAARRPR